MHTEGQKKRNAYFCDDIIVVVVVVLVLAEDVVVLLLDLLMAQIITNGIKTRLACYILVHNILLTSFDVSFKSRKPLRIQSYVAFLFPLSICHLHSPGTGSVTWVEIMSPVSL